MSTTELTFSSLSRYAGSYHGHIITVSGNGFPSKDEITVWLVRSVTEKLNIVSASADKIVVQMPSYVGDSPVKVNVTVGR